MTSRDAGERGKAARAEAVQDNDGMVGEHHDDRQASGSGRLFVTYRPSTSTAWTRAALAAIVLLLPLRWRWNIRSLRCVTVRLGYSQNDGTTISWSVERLLEVFDM